MDIKKFYESYSDYTPKVEEYNKIVEAFQGLAEFKGEVNFLTRVVNEFNLMDVGTVITKNFTLNSIDEEGNARTRGILEDFNFDDTNMIASEKIRGVTITDTNGMKITVEDVKDAYQQRYKNIFEFVTGYKFMV